MKRRRGVKTTLHLFGVCLGYQIGGGVMEMYKED